MNGAIDVGNTLVKVALFEKSKITTLISFTSNLISHYYQHLNSFECEALILSSVKPLPEHILAYLRTKSTSLLQLNSTTPLPFENKYKSDTIGPDRLALAAGGMTLAPGQNCLAINLGTCITYNFINSKSQFLGGAISPGIGMRLSSMHEMTAQLPLVTRIENTELIGDTTEKSLLSGAVNGSAAEINGYILKMRENFPDLCVILSGGDSRLMKINNCDVQPELTLIGLNKILDYNAKA